MRFEVTLVKQELQELFGLHQLSNAQTRHKDISALSKAFYDYIGDRKEMEQVVPFYVVSWDDAETGEISLFIGNDDSNNGLEQEVLPAGTYAKMEVHPKLGVLWGPSVQEAKHWFHTEWLSESCYEAVGLEYELHTERSVGKHPVVELYFAVQEKPEGR